MSQKMHRLLLSQVTQSLCLSHAFTKHGYMHNNPQRPFIGRKIPVNAE